MNTNKVVTHPTFDREPVLNPKTRGRPRATLSFQIAARRKRQRQLAEKSAATNADPSPFMQPFKWPFETINPSEFYALNKIERAYVQDAVLKVIREIEQCRRQP